MNPLLDSGENPAVASDDSSDSLLSDAEEPASVLYVKTMCAHHARRCPAVRKLRQWTILFAIGLGAVVTFNAIALIAGRAVLEVTVQRAVREELAIRFGARPVTQLQPRHEKPTMSVIGTASAEERESSK